MVEIKKPKYSLRDKKRETEKNKKRNDKGDDDSDEEDDNDIEDETSTENVDNIDIDNINDSENENAEDNTPNHNECCVCRDNSQFVNIESHSCIIKLIVFMRSYQVLILLSFL